MVKMDKLMSEYSDKLPKKILEDIQDYVDKKGGINQAKLKKVLDNTVTCLLYTSPSPRDRQKSRMPSSA